MTGNGSDLNKPSKHPDEIRILNLSAVPYDDRRRIRVEIMISAFQNPPCLELILSDMLTKQEVSRTQVVNTMLDHMNLTMHLRTSTTQTEFELKARIYYPETGTVAEKTLPVSLQEG